MVFWEGLFFGSGGGAAENEDEVVIGGDASGELCGGFGGGVVFVFKELLAAGFFGGKSVESILIRVFAGGGVVCVDIGVFVGGEVRLFGGSEARSIGTVKDKDGGVFVDARIVGEHFGNVVLDGFVVAGATDRQDIGDTINGAGGHVVFWFDEGNLTHGVEIEIGGEVGEGAHFIDGEIGTEIVAEGVSEADEISKGKGFFENFVFDADEDFLLGGTAREVAAGGAMASASKAEGLFAIDSIGSASFEDGFGIIIIFDIFV